MTSQFELVWIPLISTALFLLLGTRVLVWRRKKLRLVSFRPQSSGSILILGSSFLLLSGFSLFLALFFLITG
jgi:hypothetical protein